MGISGLLENLKSIARKQNVSTFGGLKVAVDGHCWLHRGAYSCSKDITNGVSTAKYVSFFVGVIQLLRNSGVVQILVVFDGLPLPNKVEVNQKRSATKKQNLELARAAEMAGDHKLAMTYYQRSVSVTFEMVKSVMNALDELGVAYLVSPYESDAQLAFLSKRGIVDVVITEDSDTIAYGCPKVFLKMDRDGNGDLIQRENLPQNQTLSFANWTDDQFLLFCCLAGCDYMPGLANFGVKSAYKAVAKHKTLSRVLDHLTLSGALNGYSGCFAARLEQAMLTFKHQTIYNPYTEATEPLTPLPKHGTSVSAASAVGISLGVVAATAHRKPTSDIDQRDNAELAFLGPLLDSATAKQLATGKLDPRPVRAGADGSAMNIPAPHCSEHHTPQPARDVSTRGSEGVNWEFTFPQEIAGYHPHSTHASARQPAFTTQSTIRWRSAEDHHDLHHQHAAAAQAPEPAGYGRGRGRGRSKQHTAVSSVVPVSAAAASYASQQYRSALVSDRLQGMHRQVRPRIIEPDYHHHKGGRGEGSDHDAPRADLREEIDAQFDDPGEAEVAAWDEGPTLSSEPPPTTTTASSAAPGKRKRFFDSPVDEPISPVHEFMDFEADPELPLQLLQAADEPPEPASGQASHLDSEHSYLDNAPPRHDSVADDVVAHPAAEEAPRGLAMFQDDVFYASASQRLAPALSDPLDKAQDYSSTPPLWSDSRGNCDHMFARSAYTATPRDPRGFAPPMCGVPQFPLLTMAVGMGQQRVPTAQALFHADVDAAVLPRQHQSLWSSDSYGCSGSGVASHRWPALRDNSDHAWHQQQPPAHSRGYVVVGQEHSAVSEVTRFLHDMEGYDVHTRHQRFPSLGEGTGYGMY